MADKSFGVTELNLIGSSGTPTIESPTNINLNAVNVAISTNATVGGTATFAGYVGLSTGLTVAGVTTFNQDVQFKGALYNSLWDEATSKFKLYDLAQISFGDGNDLQIYSDGTNGIIKGNDSTNILGITSVTATTFYGGGNDIVTSRWTLGADGSSHYTFTGPGGLSAATDPTIYLARGQTYEFVNSSGGSHPFQIRVSNGGSAYNTGVTNNGASSGTIKFEVPFAAPNTLVYQCTSHSGMMGNIVIHPSV